MESLQTGLSATPLALTVELDLQQVLSGERPPAPLSRAQAEELAGAVAEDLIRILGEDVQACGLITVGALYDMTEIIRPGLPIVETLFELYRASLTGGIFTPQLMAIGANDGRFPVPTVAPLRRPGSGPLLILPLLFVGEQEAIKAIQQRLEAELLEKGRAEFNTDFCIRRLFGVQPENLAYATFNDLCALLKIQLDHGGLSPLWELLEAALFRPEDSQEVRLESGNHFIQRGSAVYSPFYSFDQWAARPETDRDRPLETYFEWVKQQRTIEAGVFTHGLEIHHLRADAPLGPGCGNKLQRLAEQFGLEGTVLTEIRTSGGGLAGASVVLLTEQASPELGLLAYTVLVQGADGGLLHLANEYPLVAKAAGEVRQKWAAVAADLGLELHLSRPGRILLSADQRHLRPDLGEED